MGRLNIAQGSRLKAQGKCLEPRTLSLERGEAAQASLEMTAAIFGILLLLFSSLKVCLWSAERIVKRQQDYKTSRIEAGTADFGDAQTKWTDRASTIPLRIFAND